MSSASARVLGTYELLEEILCNFSAIDLFVMQGVNTDWHGVIARSESLRKKMFLLADGPVMHPSSGVGQLDPVYNSTAQPNPFLRFRWEHPLPAILPVGLTDGSVSAKGKGHMEVVITPTAREKQQSWRDCLLTQPPIAVTAVWTPYEDGPCFVYNPRGITLGDVCDVDERQIESAERHFGWRPLEEHAIFYAKISMIS